MAVTPSPLAALGALDPHEQEYVTAKGASVPPDALAEDIRQYRSINKANASPGSNEAQMDAPEPESLPEGTIPTLNDYLEKARPLNPDHSDRDLVSAYKEQFPTGKPSELPSLTQFLKDAKPVNPDATDEDLTEHWSTMYEPFGAKKEDLGFSGTVLEGAKSTGRSVLAAGKALIGDDAGVVETAKDQQAAPQDPALKELLADIAAGKAAAGTDPSWFERGSSVGKSLATHPKGSALLLAEQIPNSLAVLGTAGAGALIGSAAGPVGTIAGGIAGLFLGDIALETGAKVQEKAADGSFTPEDRTDALKEGAIKGSVIGAIDTATFGLTKWLTGTVGRAIERATIKVLTEEGIDVADKAAVLAARQDPALFSKVTIAQQQAREATTTLGQRVMRGSGEAGLETLGEGVGEYIGEVAATGKGDKTEALIEAFAGLGQSAGEIAIAQGMSKAKQAAIEANPLQEVAPILQQPSVDAVIKTAQDVVAGTTPNPQGIDELLDKEFPKTEALVQTQAEEAVKLQESTAMADQKAADTKLFSEVLDGYREPGDTTSPVTTDEQGNTFFRGGPVETLTRDELPATTAPTEGMSREKYDAMDMIANALGKRLMIYKANETINADGMVSRSRHPDVVLLANTATSADLFSTFAHETIHLTEGSVFHEALRDVVWSLRTPDAKVLAIARHGNLPQDRLLNEMVSDIGGTELQKPQVWEQVFAKLQERVGDEQAAQETLGFIDTLKDLISKVKELITSKPWSAGSKTLAEQYVTDLTLVHDALATAVANQIYEARSPGKTEKTASPLSTVAQTVHTKLQARLSKAGMSEKAKLRVGGKTVSEQIRVAIGISAVRHGVKPGALLSPDVLTKVANDVTESIRPSLAGISPAESATVFGPGLTEILRSIFAEPEVGVKLTLAAAKEKDQKGSDKKKLEAKRKPKPAEPTEKKAQPKKEAPHARPTVKPAPEVAQDVRPVKQQEKSEPVEKKVADVAKETVAGEQGTLFSPNTPAFKKWFGDSKVVDENGKPLVVYHGTQSGVDFAEFETNGIPTDDEGIPIGSGSGNDPSSFLGAHFAKEARVANMFAGGGGPAWLKSRHSEPGTAGSRVVPVYLKIENPKHFPSDEALQQFIYRQNVNTTGVDMYFEEHEDEDAEQYNTDEAYREEVNRTVNQEEGQYDEPSTETAQELASAAHAELTRQGFDGIIHKNTVEGGTAYVVFKPTQIKSAIGNAGTFDPTEPNISLSPSTAPTFYSTLERTLEAKMPNRASAKQVAGILSPENGVKAEELKWIGMEEFLKTKDLFTKAEVLDFVRANSVTVKEVEKSGQPAGKSIDQLREDVAQAEQDYQLARRSGTMQQEADTRQALDEADQDLVDAIDGTRTGGTKFSQYQLPGGENYRELLLTLPEDQNKAAEARSSRVKELIARRDDLHAQLEIKETDDLWRQLRNTETQIDMVMKERHDRTAFTSSHFDEPNILAHIRFNDRLVDGKKVLFLEEVQSDWHQKGKKDGYRSDNAVAGEFVRRGVVRDGKPTDFYQIYLVTKNDPEGVLWDNQRYSMRAAMDQVERLNHPESKDNPRLVPDAPFKKTWHELAMKRMLRYAAEHGYDSLAWTTGEQQAERYDLSKRISRVEWNSNNQLSAYGLDHTRLISQEVPESELADVIGKDAAEKLIAAPALNSLDTKGNVTKTTRIISGVDLKVGGEGMKGFYDLMLPSFMNKYGKKWGAKTEKLTIDAGLPVAPGEANARMAELRGDERVTVHAVPITPAMRDSVLQQGQPLFSPAGLPTPQNNNPGYAIDPPGKLDKVIRLLQDKHIDIKRVVEGIQRTGATIPDDLNPVFAEEMYPKRNEQLAKDYTNDELLPFIEAMRLHKVTQEQTDDYAWARHVIEDNLNERYKALNPTHPAPDELSGMSDAKAQAILNGANKPVMDALMRRLDAMVNHTRQMMVDYGLEKQSTIDKWKEEYKAYVPLRREGFDKDGHPTGTGRSVRGSTIRRRGGSTLKVVDVLANIAQERDQIIERGEKQKPVIAFAGLMMLHPDPTFARLDKPAEITSTDPTTGLTTTVPGDLAEYKVPLVRRWDANSESFKMVPDPAYKGRDNVVNFRIKGIDYSIVFKERNERARLVARAFKELDTVKMNMISEAIAPYTRYLAAINTQYNPIFGLVNFVRDAQFAMLTLTSTPLAGKQAQVLKNAVWSMGGIYRDARAVRRGIALGTPTALLWERFEHVGGPTGYRDLFFAASDRAEEINRLLDPSWSKVRSLKGFGKRMEDTPLFKWLSDYNLTMENAIRLGVFKTAVDQGLSDIHAASLAKNITVNFNKKGQVGAQMGALYAFFNANVQGTARIAETLFERAPTKAGFQLSSAGKKIVVGGILVGVLQTFALAMMGFDDDDPPEFVKQKNLIFPIPGTNKGYAMLPMPLGFNLLPTVGRLASEGLMNYMQGKPVKAMEKGASLLGALVTTLSPLGGSSSVLDTLAPTVADPLVGLTTNRDWNGRAIYKEDRSTLDPTPGHTRAHDTATVWAKGLAKSINWATGGTDYVPGIASPTPDAIDYVIQQATGGVGREASKAAQVTHSLITGEDLPTHKIPLAGRFVGSATGASAIRTKFYQHVRDANIAYNEFEGRAIHHEPFSEYVKSHPEARFSKAAIVVEKDLALLQKQKTLMLERGAGKDAIKLQEGRITGLMNRFNSLVEGAK